MLPGHVDWDVWRGTFTDPDLWRAPVEQVLSRHGFVLREIHPGFPGTSAAFAVDCVRRGVPGEPVRLVAKFYPPMVRGDYETEVEVRSALRECGSAVPYPRILFSGTLQDRIEWPYIIEEFRPGQAAREVWSALSRPQRDSLAAEVGEILAALHSTPLNLLPALGLGARTWREHALERAKTCVDEIAARDVHPGQRLPGSLVSDLRRYVDSRAEQVINAVPNSSLRLLHNDMTEDHVLVERAGPGDHWRVTALLDYGDAKVGAPQEEWVVLSVGLFQRDAAAMRAFLSKYRAITGDAVAASFPDAPAFRDGMLVFTLIHNFNWAIIGEAMERGRADLSALTDVDDLLDVLWPPA